MNNENTRPIKRNYFIKKEFQTKMILKFVLLLLSMAVLSSFVLYYFAGSELQTNYFKALSAGESMWSMLFPTILLTNVISMLIVGIVTIYVILYMSHKIAGPLHKIELLINNVADGNFNVNTSLRDGDEVASLAEAVDNAAVKLSSKISDISDAGKDMAEIAAKSLDKDVQSKFDAAKKKFDDEINGFTLKDTAK